MATLLKHAHNHNKYCPIWILSILGIFFISACSSVDKNEVDKLNSISYAYHYRNLDSTRVYAERALALAGNYEAGKAEAMNNLAFVSIAKMDYDRAYRLLDSISTDNQVELLIADIQNMRLCQRQSKNKNFYDVREKALLRIRRINEENNRLTPHQHERFLYAQSEFSIVNSVYFYYVGLKSQSVESLLTVTQYNDVEQDTAQWLNYLYNVGSGGIISGNSQEEINQTEFDYLLQCYQLSLAGHYPFFEAQALQAMSEHMENPVYCRRLIRDNLPAIRFINVDDMPDSLLAGNLAQRALNIFMDYGDVYQIAGGYRTLAECYWSIYDYQSAGVCLQEALSRDSAIFRAPDLVASIREQLSLVYSAINDKVNSDINRNLYLDLQEQTRQDRQLESRAEQLDLSSRQLNIMIIIVVVAIVLLIILLLLFDRMRRKNDSRFSLETLLLPLQEWKMANDQRIKEAENEYEDIEEQIQLARLHVQKNKKLNVEQRAKINFVNTITPYIDRMVHEVRMLLQKDETQEQRDDRYSYIAELTDQVNKYNNVLTNWIQMRQGELNLHIESFALQPLFDLVKKGRMGFQMKGVDLIVEDTTDVVKADKTLTLFMINTIADNARKFTNKGGKVVISSTTKENYVEISVTDTGIGMSEEQLEHVFDHKPIIDEVNVLKTQELPTMTQSSHGFGLMNCKGIIEKYRKISQIFNVCTLVAESKLGEGSRFYFRLPKGIVRIFIPLLLLFTSVPEVFSADIDKQNHYLARADAFADSAYKCNVDHRYTETLEYLDSCCRNLNKFYLTRHPNGKDLMEAFSSGAEVPAELVWFRDSLPIDYQVILDIRNESAVASLALHLWDKYTYNNKVYTSLFRERSADNTLAHYCRVMQKSESNKSVAVTILIILLLLIFPAYYLLYYRHRLYYHFCVERIRSINDILLSKMSAEDKLKAISNTWNLKATVDNAEMSKLYSVVNQIQSALHESIESDQSFQNNLEMASDELRRAQYESDRLYVSNSVLDNCLSTLKHETMYYPSRIGMLIDGKDSNLQAISELVAYYKELYSMLSTQAMRQIEGNFPVDNDQIQYLFEILQMQNGGVKPPYTVSEKDDRYMLITVQMQNLHLTADECYNLFTPLTSNVRYLICRQIIRDIGEYTNARGCGITAKQGQNEETIIEITLTKKIWKDLKLS